MEVKVENMETKIKVKVICDCGHIQFEKVEEELNFIDCKKCKKELIIDVENVEFPNVAISEQD